jgi:hypothetical protein
MKLNFLPLVLIAAIAITSRLSAADRWSTDETAVRMGVSAWFSLWSRPTSIPDAAGVKALYAVKPSAEIPVTLQTASRAGLLDSSQNPPAQFTVTMQGDRAVTTFRLPSAHVMLTWERRAGLWQIVRESITPEAQPLERVALSESARK